MPINTPKKTLCLQLADDQARMLDLIRLYQTGHLSVKQEKDELRQAIEVKWALVQGLHSR